MGREIVTISMPAAMVRWIRVRADGGEFASMSDYFRYLVREDQRMRRVLAAEKRLLERQRERAFSSAPRLR